MWVDGEEVEGQKKDGQNDCVTNDKYVREKSGCHDGE